MEGFKKSPKIACFKEGGQVGYKSRKEHSESKEMAADIAQDKKIVKKAFSIHDSQQHEEKTDLSKLKKGGRAKKETGTVRKYKCGGNVKKMAEGRTTGQLPQDLTDRIAKEENAADAAIIPKAAKGALDVVKGVGKRLYENVMGTDKQNAEAQARMDAAKAVSKKRGGKC